MKYFYSRIKNNAFYRWVTFKYLLKMEIDQVGLVEVFYFKTNFKLDFIMIVYFSISSFILENLRDFILRKFSFY